MALLHLEYISLEQLYAKWLNSSVPESFASIANYPGILVSELSQIGTKKRNIFMSFVSVLFVLAFVGNLSTLYVNHRRKLRPFFRICLISLACSDLLSCVFSTIAHMAQFNAEYLQVWPLGHAMCKFVPFVTTAAVLASSLTLVAIASDRYMAISRAAFGLWNPSLIYCGIYMSAIWLTSIGTSVPLFRIYALLHFYVLELENSQPEQVSLSEEQETTTDSELLVTEVELVQMCISQNHNVGLYYLILFSLIFLPCIVGFLWLNAIIARQLWTRRYQRTEEQTTGSAAASAKSRDEPHIIHLLQLDKPMVVTNHGAEPLLLPCALLTAFSVAMPLGVVPVDARSKSSKDAVLSPAAAARLVRHRRMVVVVICMMATFIGLRLPAWIFLIMRLYGTFSTPFDWMLYFSFCILNLASCALNPLFYTFLTETLHYLSLLRQNLLNFLCFRQCRARNFNCHCQKLKAAQFDEQMPDSGSSAVAPVEVRQVKEEYSNSNQFGVYKPEIINIFDLHENSPTASIE